MFHSWEVAGECKGTAEVTFTDEQLKGLFRRFDIDGDRRLSKQELNQAFTSLGSSFPAWRTWRALCHADENRDGYINEEEFDHLVKEELRRAFKQLGSQCSWWATKRALHRADANKNGVINPDELDVLVKYAVEKGYKAK